jgi:hypothetical protein
MIIIYKSSIINKKARAHIDRHNTLATSRIFSYIVSSKLTQYDIRNTEYEYAIQPDVNTNRQGSPRRCGSSQP